ncbi:MAG: GNAT family N-acetyltransferase [Hyphomicrobiaceae bacterium]|nr:GNAT family N-acetyltransferase [Hyphomicrobiaceae bacterium]
MSSRFLNSPTEPIVVGPALSVSPCTPQEAKVLSIAFAHMEPWSRYPFPAPTLEAYLAGQEPEAPRYSIYAQNQLAGAVGLRLNWLRGPYIQFLGVLPEFQAAGIGSEILKKLEEDAQEAGSRNLWVAASDFNEGAQRFYSRHGFARAGVLDDLVRDGIAEVLFRKRL